MADDAPLNIHNIESAAALSDDPLWYKDAVIYQLHIKSFFDANNDGVGDFPGLIAKLDYIADLGVTAIWLLPFYPSPRRDDGYDIADYLGVHPDYGTLEDCRRFIAEAHARGIRVVTELVINHTSDQHPWFQAARRAPPGSAERDLYVWSDDDRKWSDTRIIFRDTETSNWTWDPVAQAYYWHRFYGHQPDLNFDNPVVLERVLNVMRFWLGAGVDGLRLDAIPYLVERDGTDNENLPETHDILKRIRQTVDEEFPGRMLLAEANQWPEDTLQYFGDEDECHMAFHFPLMPRMYMAIAQEDRFPITDILRQTPEISPSNQWAIFLRNHDELTLEMVTDSERDYLWDTYAADRRARLNLGIRRRLAPLMQRDRRRIELMNGLLLTMPGTPIIYYGDEIGMGDNVHLGDRDGVRTPMQWSPDRNGGFSRSDPAALALPTIMDALYGYQAVNVEAQSLDPHSLLNWLRRMLAVRKQHQAFGRGSLTFLRPQNRKILAYLREHETEVILCVANMSRSAQAVELDLSAFIGRTPLELNGRTTFPKIGARSYLFTLPPHGFYWFQLCEDSHADLATLLDARPAPEFQTFVVRTDLGDLMSPKSQVVRVEEMLRDYLPARRWYQGKDSVVQSATISDWTLLPGGAGLLAFVRTTTAEGVELYCQPLAAAWESQSSGTDAPNLSMARIRRASTIGILTDGFATPAFILALIAGLRDSITLSTQIGELRFITYPDFDLEPNLETSLPFSEQSNSSVVIGQRGVLKLFRHLLVGVHPEVEMTRTLTERGFKNSATLLGEVRHMGPDGEAHTVMVLSRFIDNQGDAWSWSLDRLKIALGDHPAPHSPEVSDPPSADIAPAFESYSAFAQILGRRLAQMHAVLAETCDDPAFAPENVTVDVAQTWGQQAQAQLVEALAHLRRADERLTPDQRAAAARLVERQGRLNSRIVDLIQGAVGGVRTRIHGDLHLGQVLVIGADVAIIDFEGEPTKPLEIRRAKQSPLRDVAGILRSFDYAAARVAQDLGAREPGAALAAATALETFRRVSSSAFLEGYSQAGGEIDPSALDVFLLEKAAYELAYEVSSRPNWIDAPLSGLAAIADRILDGPLS